MMGSTAFFRLSLNIKIADKGKEMNLHQSEDLTYFGRVPKSGVSKHFRCLKEVRLFPKI